MYPEEFTGSEIQLVSKNNKKYFKIPHYKLAYYSYEEVKDEKTDLPDKLPDIVRRERVK